MMKLIMLPRVMDDGLIAIDPAQVLMVAANADADGIIEGTTAVYLAGGLAVAVNVGPEKVLQIFAEAGVAELLDFRAAGTEDTEQ